MQAARRLAGQPAVKAGSVPFQFIEETGACAMLTTVSPKNVALLSGLFARHPVDAVRLAGLFDAYGLGHAFLTYYLQNDGETALARIDDSFLLLAPAPERLDDAELAQFLRFSPRFARLLGPCKPLERVGALLPGTGLQPHLRMVNAEGAPAPSRCTVERQDGLRELAAFLRRMGQQTIAAWYADLSHRMRHGCARAYLVWHGGEPAAACLVSIESRHAGLISNVFTDPGKRRAGLGTAAVAAATNDLAAAGKCAVIECAAPLAPFYARMGYREHGETGTLSAAVP